jgi:hypothetical protein
MLAESEAANFVIVAIIVIAIIIGRVVEYFRKQKAEEEAKARRLKHGLEGSGEQAEAKPEAKPRPAAGGLQALLDALEGHTQAEEPPAKAAEPAREHSEVWDVEEESRRAHDFDMERASFEHARPREPEIVAAPPPVPEEPAVEEPKAVKAAAEHPPEADVASPRALAAVGLLAGPGGPPLRDQARRGILWSVVLGSPRGTVPYGERGASEAPGGIV